MKASAVYWVSGNVLLEARVWNVIIGVIPIEGILLR